MKPTTKIVILSVGLGLILWLTDASLDHYIFQTGSFLDVLILDVPSRGLCTRALILICFIMFGIVGARLLTLQKKAELKLATALEFQQQLVNAIPVPVFYKDLAYLYTGCNKSFTDFFGFSSEDLIGKGVADLVPKEIADVCQENDADLVKKAGVQIDEFDLQHISKGRRHVLFHKATFHNPDGKVSGLIGTMLDITERTAAEKKQETLTLELQEALNKVKTLSGFLPICASCHKVRADHPHGNQIEDYVQKHPQTELNHRICPDCMRKLYPDFAEDMGDT